MRLILDEDELKKQKEFLERVGHDHSVDVEEDVSGMASYHYEVHTSNLGGWVTIFFGKESEVLTSFDNL